MPATFVSCGTLYLLLLPFLEKKPAGVENVRADNMFSASDVLDRMRDWAEEEKIRSICHQGVQ